MGFVFSIFMFFTFDYRPENIHDTMYSSCNGSTVCSKLVRPTGDLYLADRRKRGRERKTPEENEDGAKPTLIYKIL